MTALLLIIAACLAIIGWQFCAALRDAAHEAAIRRRIAEIAEESAGDWPAISALKMPHNDEDIAR